MIIKDENARNRWREKNKDPYGACVISTAEAWADVMERELAKGTTLEACADACFKEANTQHITGFMYGCAVSYLHEAWEHGEALVKWHNAQMGCPDAKGAVNPALLTVRKR